MACLRVIANLPVHIFAKTSSTGEIIRLDI